MSREEELIRSTTRAIASAVREVPPLRLEAAADELRSPGISKAQQSPTPSRTRRWRSWLVPAIAATVVAAIAVALVLVRDITNDGAISPNPTSSADLGGAPRYYVALTQFGVERPPRHRAGRNRGGRLGHRRADSQVRAPGADDLPERERGRRRPDVRRLRRDVLYRVIPAEIKNGIPVAKSVATLTGSWYEVRLAPGTASPARLTKPAHQAVVVGRQGGGVNAPAPGQIWRRRCRRSGQELAVADIPDGRRREAPQNWQEVKVFSVATGRAAARLDRERPERQARDRPRIRVAGVPAGPSALTWIDRDRALTLATSRESQRAR